MPNGARSTLDHTQHHPSHVPQNGNQMSAYEPLDADHYLNAPAVGECNRCHRKTWDAEMIGTEDRMTQPDGGPCGGMFEEAR